MKTRYLKTEIALNPDRYSDFDDEEDGEDNTVFKPCVIDLWSVSFFYESLDKPGTTVHMGPDLAMRVPTPFVEFSDAFYRAAELRDSVRC